jgi:nucleoside-diphosphate-sugar epimerase
MSLSFSSKRAMVIFGASGHLGSAIATALKPRVALHPRWQDHQGSGVSPQLEEFLNKNPQTDIIFAGGITDPHTPEALLNAANCLLPLKIIANALDKIDVRFMTFGTIFERFPLAGEANLYVKSKIQLCEKITEAFKNAPARCLHVRLHTLYGGNLDPKPYMFLGQVAKALRMNTPFLMSSGEQLREYHHVDNISAALGRLLNQDWQLGTSPILELNSGRPIKLVDLAKKIFQAFEKDELLKVGALQTPRAENLNQIFPPTDTKILSWPADVAMDVILWLKKRLK